MSNIDQNQSGGANLEAGRDTTVGGDVTGRDKIESAGGHIIHTGPNSTVNIGSQTSPVPGEPLYHEQRDVDKAVQKYRQCMRDLYSTTRMLGKPEPVPLEGIFTDVYLLDRPTAMQRFDIETLKAGHVERGSFSNNLKRVNALQLASQKSHLFILGKPGAGKTTFLKYLTLRAATGDLHRVPIFISLNNWAGSGSKLLPFIQRQFEICAVPDAQPIIQRLLQRGEALVCFDGLDEVNEADDKRSAITQAIRDFTTQYPNNQYLITCRIAATDYTFEKFTYVEMADFTPGQVQVFARKWFGQDESKAKRFIDELNRAEHRGLLELAQTPLLLTLLCLNFEETLTFPTRRAELYEEALDALLKKWDASRNIKRDGIYRGLSLGHKRQLLTRIAAEYFDRGEIFFPQSDLAKRVSTFLKTLPDIGTAAEPEGEVVVKAVEAQHGIFVERAYHIYSFSHLTLQEYFTARYVADHTFDGALERLINQHFTDDRWREVFFLTVSMLPTEAADAFFAAFRRTLDALIMDDKNLVAYGRWAAKKAADYTYLGHPAVARAEVRATAITFDNFARAFDLDRSNDIARALARVLDRGIDLALARALDHNLARAFARARDLARALDLDRDRDLARDLDLDRALDLDFDRAHHCDFGLIFIWYSVLAGDDKYDVKLLDVATRIAQHVENPQLRQALLNLNLSSKVASTKKRFAWAAQFRSLLIRHRNIGHEWNFTDEQQDRLDKYERGTVLLAACLKLATVSDRKAIENRMFLPPEG